jgi:7-cyano-7-deazaguanine synthase
MLLSGGLDSVTALAWSLSQGYVVEHALSFTYGQQHIREIEAARAIAQHYGIAHDVIELAPIQGSRLTNLGNIPQRRDLSTIDEDIAPTYVPNRNMIFLSYAASRALLGPSSILIGGWNAADGSNYPDCRDDFLAAAERTLQLATLRPFSIVRPLIDDDKPAIVRRAIALDVPIHLTWTCYLGGEAACGTCDACQLRLAAFRTCGAIDPVPYAIPTAYA